MPNRDKTGPYGKGKLTGRGLGSCNNELKKGTFVNKIIDTKKETDPVEKIVKNIVGDQKDCD